MDNLSFFKTFSFHRISFHHNHYTDMRAGARMNFLAILRVGQARILSEGKRLALSPGDLFFIPKGLCYQSYWEADDLVSWDSFGFEYFPDGDGRCLALQKIPYGDSLLATLHDLTSDMRPTCRSIGMLYQLLGTLLPVLEAEKPAGGDHVLRTMTECLERDPRCQIGELADACHLSVTGLYASLKRKSGITPNALRHRILVRKATELLSTTDLPIEEISGQLGFSSSSYFRKVLFSETGQSPSEIRKKASRNRI